MRKRIAAIYLIGFVAQSAWAGEMGSVATEDYFVPFISGEATVSWNTVQSATIFGSSPSISKQLWGGRGALGIGHTFRKRFGYTLEMGWGYYGSTTSYVSGTIPSGSLTIHNNGDLYGFDLLAGLTYNFDPTLVYIKVGAMANNRKIDGSAIFTNVNPTTNANYISTNNIKTTNTNVLPEIKVGGIYALNERLGLSLAYMHVFGNNNYAAQTTGVFANPYATAGLSSVVSAQNPSLDSILFGLNYQFK